MQEYKSIFMAAGLGFQQRLEGVKPLIYMFVFFVLLLCGAWISYRIMRKYQERFGNNRVFYADEEHLIINKLKNESAFRIFIPFNIRFRLESVEDVEIGYGRFRHGGCRIFVRIAYTDSSKSLRYCSAYKVMRCAID